MSSKLDFLNGSAAFLPVIGILPEIASGFLDVSLFAFAYGLGSFWLSWEKHRFRIPMPHGISGVP